MVEIEGGHAASPSAYYKFSPPRLKEEVLWSQIMCDIRQSKYYLVEVVQHSLKRYLQEESDENAIHVLKAAEDLNRLHFLERPQHLTFLRSQEVHAR